MGSLCSPGGLRRPSQACKLASLPGCRPRRSLSEGLCSSSQNKLAVATAGLTEWGDTRCRKGRTVLAVTGRGQLDLRDGGRHGSPQKSGSLRQLGKCPGICGEVSPPVGFGVTELNESH